MKEYSRSTALRMCYGKEVLYMAKITACKINNIVAVMLTLNKVLKSVLEPVFRLELHHLFITLIKNIEYKIIAKPTLTTISREVSKSYKGLSVDSQHQIYLNDDKGVSRMNSI